MTHIIFVRQVRVSVYHYDNAIDLGLLEIPEAIAIVEKILASHKRDFLYGLRTPTRFGNLAARRLECRRFRLLLV